MKWWKDINTPTITPIIAHKIPEIFPNERTSIFLIFIVLTSNIVSFLELR